MKKWKRGKTYVHKSDPDLTFEVWDVGEGGRAYGIQGDPYSGPDIRHKEARARKYYRRMK